MVDDEILTVRQAAKLLQVSEQICREYLRDGRIPGKRVRRRWRLVKSELIESMKGGDGGAQ